jgi:hypothetical protein
MTDGPGAFLTARLSAVRVEPRLCALPYGLTWADLRDCLPGFTTPAHARAWVAHEKQGLDGGVTSRILTLGYQTQGGHERTETVFVKQAADPAKAEAARYRFLEHQGVPVPRLLASVDTEPGEVIVLEFLPAIGARPQDADDLLRLVARVNAVEHPPADLFTPSAGLPVDVFDAKVATALELLADDPASAGLVAVVRRVQVDRERRGLDAGRSEPWGARIPADRADRVRAGGPVRSGDDDHASSFHRRRRDSHKLGGADRPPSA